MAHTVTLAEERYGGTVRRTVLGNGLRIITEAVPRLRSAAFGVFVAVGSRHEPGELAGASHFLEHLLFKGTERRSAWDISAQLEAVGGDTNAFTTKEYTCFYARVLDTDLSLAVDVVTDMLAHSVLDEAEMATETQVVLEEIAMHADEPDDQVHDVFAAELLGSHPLARPILGTAESVTGMRREALYEFYRQRYRPEAMVVAAAGNLDHAAIVEQVAAVFEAEPAVPGTELVRRRVQVPVHPGGVRVVKKDTDQAHLVLGGGGIDRFDERRYALDVLNQVLGGGMSSRLFQQVRERRGLAYAVYSFASRYTDAGVVGVYAGCAPERLAQVIRVVRGELAAVAADGVTAEELARGVGMLRGATVLGLEDSGALMARIGKGELLYGDFLSVDELLCRIEAVDLDQVRAVAAAVLNAPLAVTVIGPVSRSAVG